MPAAKNGENILELRVYFRPGQPEVGFIGEDQPAKRRARDLFAATVRKILQISIESVREAERQRGDRGALVFEIPDTFHA